MTVENENNSWYRIFLVILLFAGSALRIFWPESDPTHATWSGYIADEGRWTAQARNLVLFGEVDLSDWLSFIHLALAPLFQIVSAISFSVLGVGFSAARLLSMVSGCGLMLVAFFFLRGKFSRDALIVTLIAIALMPDLVFYSRIAIPEMPSLFFQAIAFFVLVSDGSSKRRAAVSAFLLILAVAMKATVLPLMFIFLGIIVLSACLRGRVCWSATGYFLGVIIGPSLVIGFGGYLLLGSESSSAVLDKLGTLGSFVRPRTPYAFIDFLLQGKNLFAIYFLILVAWLVAGCLIAVSHLPRDHLGVIYVASAVWVLSWLFLTAALGYFPQRYTFHALLPAIVHIGAGISLLQGKRYRSSVSDEPMADGRPRQVALLWLTLPAAVMAIGLVISGLDSFGFTIERQREQIVLIFGIWLAAFAIVVRMPFSGRRNLVLVAFPLIFVWLWQLATGLGLVPASVWSTGSEDFLSWAVIWIVSGLLTFAANRAASSQAKVFLLAVTYILAVSGFWLYELSPTIVSPSRTIAGSANYLRSLEGSGMRIVSRDAESIFLGTRLRYHTGALDGRVSDCEDDRLPDLVVVAFRKVNQQIFDCYQKTHEIELAVVPTALPEPHSLELYKLKSDAENSRDSGFFHN